MSKKEIANQQDQMPAYMNQGPARGSENVSTDDIQLPRVDVIQALSPQIKKSDPSYIQGAEQGVFFNTLTSDLYGGEVTFIPVYYRKQWLNWYDRKKSEGGLAGVFESAAEADAARIAHEDAAKLETVETAEHLVLVITEDGPVEALISMAKSKMKCNRKLNSLIKLNGGDRFSRRYKLTAFEDSGQGGDFWNIQVANDTVEPWPNEETYKLAEALYESVASGARNVATNYNAGGTEEVVDEEGTEY